jgi:ubiquinone/menaquinone biosynthesis C-methylase UbiE
MELGSDTGPKDSMDSTAAKDIVRRGYDALSERYDQAYGAETKYRPWLDRLLKDLPTKGGGTVLDVGCGSGVPVARTLTEAGHQVLGVDISEVQIQRARERVPDAEYVHADITALDFSAGSFDAVVCLYSLIHIPVAEQPELLRRIAAWLRPGGRLLATTGHHAWTGTDDDWLGGGTTMWWSHADADTNRRWIGEAGLELVDDAFAPENDSGHLVIWAQKRTH